MPSLPIRRVLSLAALLGIGALSCAIAPDELQRRLLSVRIVPDYATLSPGTSRQFVAQFTWSDSSTTPPPLTFAAEVGGTVNTTGLYVAPATPGFTRVIVSSSGGDLSDTANILITGPATLTSLTIVPATITLAPGATHQFVTQYAWSDGSTGAPPLTFSLLGVGTLSGTGFYTSPGAEGTAKVIVRHTGGARLDTADVTIAAPQTALYPNEPAGFTRVMENNFSGVPGLAGQLGTIDGNFQTLRSPLSRIVVVSDTTATQSPPGVLQIDFAANTQPGYSAPPNSGYRLFTGWDGPNNLNNTEYSEVYESVRFKVVGPNFETQTAGVKMMGYWGVANNNGSVATSPGPVELYHFFVNGHEGGPGTSLETQWNIFGYTQGVNSEVRPQNRNLGTKAQVGQWNQFEIYLKLNTIGQANGIWRWWLNGVLLGEYTDMVFITATKSSGFFGRTYDAVWGGQGGTAKTRTDYLWLDHLYTSGVFLRDKVP